MSETNENKISVNNPPDYSWEKSAQPEDAESAVMIRRKVKKGYNWAGAVILWQQLFAMAIMMIVSIVITTPMTFRIMAENPGMDQQQLQQAVADQMAAEQNMVIINAVVTVAANIISMIIICAGKKQFKLKNTLGRSELPASSVLIAAIGVFGIQGASVMIQSLVMELSGYSGISEEIASAASFSDDPVNNIVLFVYMVIAGPILEELMFRGVAMNLLAPVNRTFALFASSLLFGLMHANFNQIFNGFLLGLLFGYIALKSGSIIPSMICHAAANFNAYVVSFIFEYKLLPTLGEEAAAKGEMAVFAAELVIGAAALVFLLKKHGRIAGNDIIVTDYSYTLEGSDEKALTWTALLKSPTFWGSAALCLFNACLMVTAIS